MRAGGRPWQLYSVFGLICCDHLAFSIGLVHAELNTGRVGSALSRRLWSITGWHIFPGIPLLSTCTAGYVRVAGPAWLARTFASKARN